MPQPLLELKNLNVAFDTERGQIRPVRDVSLAIFPGQTVALVGESGCGKSVTSLSILRLIPEPPGKILSGSISLEGRKTGNVAAVQQVTEQDEELFLISSGGQVIRTETNTINRYSSGARGVIVMRLAEGDRVVAIAAFREGLAERDGVDDNDDPTGAPPTGTPAS